MEEEMTPEEVLEAALRKAVNDLMEHFSSVQILASVEKDEPDNKNTEAHHLGAGNWYSRVGMVHEFMAMDDERVRMNVREESDED